MRREEQECHVQSLLRSSLGAVHMAPSSEEGKGTILVESMSKRCSRVDEIGIAVHSSMNFEWIQTDEDEEVRTPTEIHRAIVK